jgi:hypothetical protein
MIADLPLVQVNEQLCVAALLLLFSFGFLFSFSFEKEFSILL